MSGSTEDRIQKLVAEISAEKALEIATRVQEKAQHLISALGPPDMTEDELAAVEAGVSAGFSATLLVLKEEGLL